MNIPAIRPPASLFDREAEWADLVRFVSEGEGPRIGVVYGRRRQGKSFMLSALMEATAGFYYQSLEEETAPALARFGASVTSFAGLPAWAGGRFEDWVAAVRALAEQANGRPLVIDEFPYLSHQSPELPSVIQRAYDEARVGRHPSFRLIVCGSALSIMTELLTGQKALRGRAMLDMSLGPFDFRATRSFWGIDDVETAFLVDAVVGGPPGYRDLLGGAAPASPAEFDDWLADGILNPSHALFHEAEYLLSEEPALVDRALYRSIISAIAAGESTRRGVSSVLGRPDTALSYPLEQLARTHFVVRDNDVLRTNRPLLRVADQLLRFHFAVVRPDLARFEIRRTREAWSDAGPRFRSHVIGPHFEAMARRWMERYASEETLGGRPRRVGFAQVNDPEAKQQFELDVVVESADSDRSGRQRLLAVGEAKSSDAPRTLSDLARLERLRASLGPRADVARTRLFLFGRAGFAPDLLALAASRADVELVDLARLYEGS